MVQSTDHWSGNIYRDCKSEWTITLLKIVYLHFDIRSLREKNSPPPLPLCIVGWGFIYWNEMKRGTPSLPPWSINPIVGDVFSCGTRTWLAHCSREVKWALYSLLSLLSLPTQIFPLLRNTFIITIQSQLDPDVLPQLFTDRNRLRRMSMRGNVFTVHYVVCISLVRTVACACIFVY